MLLKVDHVHNLGKVLISTKHRDDGNIISFAAVWLSLLQ